MPTSPEIIELVHDILKNDLGLSEIKEWNKATGLLTLASPGGSIGLEEEKFEEYTKEQDLATANLSILIWTKNADPVAGEAEVRSLAQAVRLALVTNRTLGGAADDSFVLGIRYATAEGGKSLMLHLAEVDYRVNYYADRLPAENGIPIETVNHELEAE